MNEIKKRGSYRGYVVEHAVSKTKKGFPQLVIKAQAVEIWDEDEKIWVDISSTEDVETTSYQCLFGGSGEETLGCTQIMDVFGWDGKSFSSLNSMDLSQTAFQWRMEEDEYNGKITLKMSWIDKADVEPGGGIRKLNEEELKDLDREYSNGLKNIAKKPEPQKAPSKPKPKPKPKSVKPEPVAEPTAEQDFDEFLEGEKKVLEAEDAEAAKKKPAPKKKKAAPKPPPPSKKKLEIAGCTKEEAWGGSYEKKAPSVTDDVFTSGWTRAVTETASGKDEDEMSPEEWGLVRDRLIGEYGIPY